MSNYLISVLKSTQLVNGGIEKEKILWIREDHFNSDK